MKVIKYLACIFLCTLLCVFSTSCIALRIWDLGYRIQEKDYYSDKNVFVTVTATCINLATNEEWFPGEYFINVKDMVYERSDVFPFIDGYFNINEANSKVLKEAGIEEKLLEGTVFKFISAPEYFGDGYVYPIVGLEINGEVLLDFETGYENLMDTYKFVP